MTLDITGPYFNQHNTKMCNGKNFSNFKKPIMTSTPHDVANSKYLDDSGYISPGYTFTPLALNEHSAPEAISTEKSFDYDHRATPPPPSRLDWQYAEEEDVNGKKQLRRSLPVIVSVKCLNTLNISKALERQFDCQNIIGKKIGRRNCDIVSELDQKNISAFLAQLVDYLSPEDVHSMQSVSKKWQAVCGKINQARIKLKKFEERKKFKEIQNKENVKPKYEDVKKSVTKCDLFHQCAASLQNDQHLQKCLKCQHPAKVYPISDKGVCTNSSCNYQFCAKCLANYHGSAPCVLIGVKRLPKEILNTKKAKKFLKRL